jgi:hypothetical protein
MLDAIEKSEAELPLVEQPTKRELIEDALRTDANRSDRAIADVLKVDHKTVGAHRKRMGIASLGNSPYAPTPTEQRHMLLEGCKDFDKLYPPGPSEVATSEEAVDNAIADGKIKLVPEKVIQAAVDQCNGHMQRLREERQAEDDLTGQKNQERTLLLPRKETTIQHDDEVGEWIIRQRRWPDEDQVIVVDDEDIHRFVDLLTDHLGYGRAP